MASKRRLRRKACTGKVRHASQDDANLAKYKSGFKGVIPYRCKHCNGFHLGHPPKEIRQAIAAGKTLGRKYGTFTG